MKGINMVSLNSTTEDSISLMLSLSGPNREGQDSYDSNVFGHRMMVFSVTLSLTWVNMYADECEGSSSCLEACTCLTYNTPVPLLTCASMCVLCKHVYVQVVGCNAEEQLLTLSFCCLVSWNWQFFLRLLSKDIVL